MLKVNDVVQFIESHKWIGCFGFVAEVKPSKIMVGVPVPERGIAYVYCKETDVEVIGEAVLITKEESNND
jgi:hypothetical protein